MARYLNAIQVRHFLPLTSYSSLCFNPEGLRGSLLLIEKGGVEIPSGKIEMKLTKSPSQCTFSRGETLTLFC